MARKFKTNETYGEDLLNLGVNFYNVEDYIDSSTPILHECENNHQWSLRPNDALKGSNCPQCSRLGISPVKLYHIQFLFNDTIYYKLGISNTPLNRRFRSKWKDLQMRTIWEVQYSNRFLAKAQEQLLLGQNIDKLVNVNALLERGGDTETLSIQIEKPVN